MKYLNGAVAVLGTLSFFGLIGTYLALHDIWHDYASPELWARAGQPLPVWYSHGNLCPLEWGMMQVSFLLLLAFHIALFVRMLKRSPRPAAPDGVGSF